MTINDPKAVREALLNDGVLEDIQFYDIFQYIGTDDKVHFAFFTGEIPDMINNPYVKSYVQLFSGKALTPKGDLFLTKGAV